MIQHLYIHIPFCPKICPYCSFYKEASDKNKTMDFLRALLREAEIHAPTLRPQTVFFGGGTPTALSTPQLEFLLGGLCERIDFSEVTEWTFEMNPATVSVEKARLLLAAGVNRVSMGVQAWQDSLLQTLGRVHNARQVLRSYETLRTAGFENINLDLIFGVPGQTLQDWEESLAKTLALAPEHISAYCLTYEEDTAFFESLMRGEFPQPDEEKDARFFEITMDRLTAAGYEAYEISNFALPGRRCLHNLAYWRGSDYLGLGPSAFSTVGERRYRNIRNTSLYVSSTLAGKTAIDFEEETPPAVRLSEFLAFGLRTADGVPTHLLDPIETNNALRAGLLETNGPNARLTRSGRLLADELAARLVPSLSSIP
jgi:oxygen-independent coproporphyrinogen-3 oxidase